MATTDGEVVIGLEMNIDDAEKQLASLKKEFFSLEKDVKLKEFLRDSLVKQSAEAAANLDLAKKKLEEMKADSAGTYSEAAIKKQEETVKVLQSNFDKLASETEKYTAQIERGNQELDFTKQRFEEVSQKASEIGQGNFLSRAREELNEFAQGLKTGFSGIVNSALSFLGEKIQGIGARLREAFSIRNIKEFGNGILKAAENLNVLSKLSKSAGRIFTRLGKMIRRVFVFSVITAGLRAMRTQIKKYLSVNSELNTALSQLKGVFLTAFQPIYDAVVPALTSMLNVITRVVAEITKLTSIMFGTTAKKAQSNAKALNQQAEALESTGAAADEAAGSLAGFDEINTIQTEDKGGGGSAAQDGVEAAFDYDYGKDVFGSWGEAFSSFLDNVLAGIPKLRQAFANFAQWLNGTTANFVEMFTFPGVREKVAQIGAELASAVNGLVNSINWYQLGQALGSGFDLALQFLVNFFYGVDWINLGTQLAEAVNGLVASVNWLEFGNLLWAGFKIGIETLAGFLLGLDMTELAQAASNIATGFFNSITETLANIDWFALGEQVKEFLVNIDWAGVAESVFEAIGAAFGAAASFLWGLIHDAWESVVQWWHDNAEDEDGNFIIEGLWNGIKKALSDVVSWLKENVVDPFVNGFKKLFRIGSPSKVMEEQGEFIMEGLKNGIGSMIESVKQKFKDLWESVKQWYRENVQQFFTLDYWKGLGGDMISGLMDGLRGIFDSLSGWASDVWSSITGLFSSKNAKSSISNSASGSGVRTINYSSLPPITDFKIPALARGAVIPPNREFMAVLGDQANGKNIEAPEDLIRKIVREEAGGNAEILRQILQAIKDGKVLTVDKQVLARTAAKGINDMTRQAGKPVLLV